MFSGLSGEVYARGLSFLSLDPPVTALPDAVVIGAEPLLIVGAIAGGEPKTSKDVLGGDIRLIP